MLITQEKAQQIADLSYKMYKLGLQEKGFVTYKKAAELDKNTGDKIIEELTAKIKLYEMEKEVEIYGGKLYYVGEIAIIDNYLYLDSIEYEYHTTDNNKNNIQKVSGDIKCIFSDGSTCTIPSGMKSRMYAPHIYGGIVDAPSGVKGSFPIGTYPSIGDPVKRVLYLKMIIAEDRLINPYIIIQKGGYMGRVDHKYIFPMYEATRNLADSEKEIDLLNEVIKACDGNLIIELGALKINIKASVLYLESIDRYDLATTLRAYEKDPFFLNSVIDYAHKGHCGISFNGGFRKVVLI